MESQKSWNANIYNIFITLGFPSEISEILLKMVKRNYFISDKIMEERRIFDMMSYHTTLRNWDIYKHINHEIKQKFNRHAPYLIKKNMIREFLLNPQISFIINDKKILPKKKMD